MVAERVGRSSPIAALYLPKPTLSGNTHREMRMVTEQIHREIKLVTISSKPPLGAVA